MKNLKLDQLITSLPIIQNQLDALVAFDASPMDLSNGIINSAFSALYKDLVHLYIAYQTAIIRLIELFFTINQIKKAQELYDCYKKFLVRMHKVSDFMSVINCVGLDSSDMPKLSNAPNFALSLMEKHLRNLESSSRRQVGDLERVQSTECLPKPDYGSLGCRYRVLRRSQRGSSNSLNNWAKSPETVRPSQKRTLDCTLDKVAEELVALDKRKRESCDIITGNDTQKQLSKYQPNKADEFDLLLMGDSHEEDNLMLNMESSKTGQFEGNQKPQESVNKTHLG